MLGMSPKRGTEARRAALPRPHCKGDVGGNEGNDRSSKQSQVPAATRFALCNVTGMQEKIHTRDHGEELASGQISMLRIGVERRSTRKLCHRKLELLTEGCTCSGA